jgi:hypothetical protein
VVAILDSKQRRSKFIGSGEDKDAAGILNDFLNKFHLVDGFDT